MIRGGGNNALIQEFSIEIPDKEADAIHSGAYTAASSDRAVSANKDAVNQAVDYIMSQPDGAYSNNCGSRARTDYFVAH